MHHCGGNTPNSVEVDPFTQAFHEIDTDSDGIISRTDLENFVRRNDIEDDTLVRSWMKLFETSEGNFITMKAYREKLGLLDDDKHCSKATPVSSPGNRTYSGLEDPEIRVISASMSAERQSEIINQIYRLASSSDSRSKFNEAQTTRMELPRNVSIISTRMILKDQVKITTKAVELLERCKRHGNMEMFTSKLKAYLDEKYGLIWHVVCTTGSYWMNYAHDGPWTLNFNVDEFQVLTWKTPFNNSISHSKAN